MNPYFYLKRVDISEKCIKIYGNIIKMEIAMKDIRLLKLSSGEEIVCEYASETENEILVKRPFLIGPDPMRGGLMIAPWTVSSFEAKEEDIFPINKNCVMMNPTVIPEKIKDIYIEKTSNLTISAADKSLILG